MADKRLVPPGIRDERSIAMEALAARLQQIDLTPLLVLLIDQVNASALPHLAEQFGVTGFDGWLMTTNDDERRALIKKAFQLHRYKGTPWAVKEVIKACGYPDVSVGEHYPTRYYDGTWNYDHTDFFGSVEGQWALFRVIVELGEDKPLSAATRELLKGGVNAYKNARSWLQHLGFGAKLADVVTPTEAIVTHVRPRYDEITLDPIRYNGVVTYDGSQTYAIPADVLSFTVNWNLRYGGVRQYDGAVTYLGVGAYPEAM
jgi:phage tail P2-like protein